MVFRRHIYLLCRQRHQQTTTPSSLLSFLWKPYKSSACSVFGYSSSSSLSSFAMTTTMPLVPFLPSSSSSSVSSVFATAAVGKRRFYSSRGGGKKKRGAEKTTTSNKKEKKKEKKKKFQEEKAKRRQAQSTQWSPPKQQQVTYQEPLPPPPKDGYKPLALHLLKANQKALLPFLRVIAKERMELAKLAATFEWRAREAEKQRIEFENKIGHLTRAIQRYQLVLRQRRGNWVRRRREVRARRCQAATEKGVKKEEA